MWLQVIHDHIQINKNKTKVKVIIKYNPEYKTPVKVHEVEKVEDAWDLIDEAKQSFGQGIILTDHEFEQLLNQNKDEK